MTVLMAYVLRHPLNIHVRLLWYPGYLIVSFPDLCCLSYLDETAHLC